LIDKKPRMKQPIECMMCADCVAMCPEDAITATRNYRYTGYYKTIGFGNLQKPRL
jgi:formate hydrogenlyase subunit 6/NADH:ubiquinone oxidoreductase subunit I